MSKGKSKVYVIRSTPKSINVESSRSLTRKEMSLLATFGSQFQSTSKDYVVATLEKWAPGLGLCLIRHKFGVFQRFSDLTRDEYLRIFCHFLDHCKPDSTVWQMLGPHDEKCALKTATVA